MFTILDVVQPATIEDAYQLLISKRNHVILGGCTFLRMGSQKIAKAIELSKLNLCYITEQDNYIAIGASTTLRDLETHPLLQQYCSGIIVRAVRNIIGVQFRNIATIGASVFSKYGFSDVITALAACDAEVELHKNGRMKLTQFLDMPYVRDILVSVFLPNTNRVAAYHNFRNSASDFPILTVAASCLNNQWLLAVGARPGRTKLAQKAAAVLSAGGWTEAIIEEAAGQAAGELCFETNMRATAEYRQVLCRIISKQAIREVVACRS